MPPGATYTDRFRAFLTRPIAEQAAKTLADGSEIQLLVSDAAGSPIEKFVFTRTGGKNSVVDGAAKNPHLEFALTSTAAETVLSDQGQDIGSVGVNIMKLVVSKAPDTKIRFKVHAGFMTLFAKGYFGVLTSGGASVASFLASRGLSGINAIKAVLNSRK